jgi:putative transposase
VQADAYLQACCRYVELNPVRAGMVDDPASYRWSSCPAKVGCIQQSWLDVDPFYLSLGKSTAQRAKKYAIWLREAIPEAEWRLIREATQRGQMTAHERFAEELSARFGRCLVQRGPGRPRKDGK